jgi:hypothetical protein
MLPAYCRAPTDAGLLYSIAAMPGWLTGLSSSCASAANMPSNDGMLSGFALLRLATYGSACECAR